MAVFYISVIVKKSHKNTKTNKSLRLACFYERHTSLKTGRKYILKFLSKESNSLEQLGTSFLANVTQTGGNGLLKLFSAVDENTFGALVNILQQDSVCEIDSK